MPQSVLLIAGRSSGIGLSTSVVAGKHGYRVVATMRNLDGAGPLRAAADEAGVELDVRRLDVTAQASITTCVDGVVADHGHRDGVVNTEVSTTPGIVKDGAGTPTGELQEPPAMAPLLSMMVPGTADVLARGVGVGDPCLG